VAYSGGRDSTALLHATAVQAAAQGLRVVALHVHHGLSALADDWWAHGEAQCAQLTHQGFPVVFAGVRLLEAPGPGDSVEAWARQARYNALGALAQAHGARWVLLAHHRRDQAETVLLQALRGGGLAGLSGMPQQVQRGGITWLRPWLHRPRQAIEAYVQRHRLHHIEDDSNHSARFARNRLRLQVWPALEGAFAQAEGALCTVATWAQEASAALDELASMDLAHIANPAGLRVAAWCALSAPRRSNALRAWLKQQAHGASANLVTRLMAELPEQLGQSGARWPLANGLELRLHGGVLRWVMDDEESKSASPPESRLSVLQPGAYALPGWGGTLYVTAAELDEPGVPLAWLAYLELHPRSGGEQFQAAVNRPPRSLKKQYQGVGMADWQRSGPLIYSGGQLVFVPGLGLDARILGLPGQALMTLRWA
jgi:tRNA(Ile)-lysidine synthase